MRLHRIAIAAALAAVCLVPGLARGAGYGIYEQGAAALGMAGAYTASVHDASAAFYNPAALVRLDGREAYFGGTWLNTHNSFAGVDPYPGFGVSEEMETGNFFPPTVYWANHFTKNWAYAVGFNAPFGLGISWKNPSEFSGRERVTKASLTGLNAGLNLAWSANDRLSFGAGFNTMFAGVELNSIRREIVPGGGGAQVNVADVKLKASNQPGYGWNLSSLWIPDDDWRFGFSYRSQVDVKIKKGEATFKQILSGNPAFDAAVAAGLPGDQNDVHTTLHFPALWAVGAAWHPTKDWTWEADFNWTQWSAFDSLVIQFPSQSALDTSVPEEYNDQFRVSVGAEHQLATFAYRFGYYFDQAAAPTESVTPLLPDANRHGVTVGYSRKLGTAKQWTLDWYYLALFFEKRSTEGQERDGFNGTYKAFANATGLSLAYRW
ncbi:MAG: outer membrane protein transport protein [Candidatus Eisenbacteria bacterium]|nr:outer membrane protein transport protein [Candidatus Eisenbacteria bacterium]